jgi:hypothetical protein
MKPIQPEETILEGKWVGPAGRLAADDTERRIEWLVEHALVRIGSDLSGWDTLFRDPADGRLWELSFPNSESHGGGPRRLACIDGDTATRKYGRK